MPYDYQRLAHRVAKRAAQKCTPSTLKKMYVSTMKKRLSHEIREGINIAVLEDMFNEISGDLDYHGKFDKDIGLFINDSPNSDKCWKALKGFVSKQMWMLENFGQHPEKWIRISPKAPKAMSDSIIRYVGKHVYNRYDEDTLADMLTGLEKRASDVEKAVKDLISRGEDLTEDDAYVLLYDKHKLDMKLNEKALMALEAATNDTESLIRVLKAFIKDIEAIAKALKKNYMSFLKKDLWKI